MPGPVFLEGTEVILRPPERDDIEFIQECMNDPAVWRPALGTEPMNRQQGEEFFENTLSAADRDSIKCLVCEGTKPLGLVSLTGSEYGPDETRRARSMEVAYYLKPDYHNKGYGSDAVATIIEYAFRDRNIRRIDARAGSFNEGSIALLESLGFTREGTRREAAWYRGEYYDTYLYGLLRSEWDGYQ